MIIKYEDIILRAIEEEDLELLKDMMNDPEIENMVSGYSFPVSTFQQNKWFQNMQNNNNELRLVIDSEKDGAIGAVMLTDIDWKNRNAAFHLKLCNKKNVRGRGYGTKATKAMIKYAFEQLNLHCLTTNNMEYNATIEALKEKCGFIKEGTLRERIFKNGRYYNTHVWSIINKSEINE